MAMKRLGMAVFAASVMHASIAHSQSVAIELAQTGGYSTEDVAAIATQLRAFGELTPARLRFNVEVAWAARSAEGTDVFGAAYPYDAGVQLIEAYGERTFLPGRGLFGLKVGRYRTPFGISSGSDHAYNGFLRAPLIRYDGYFALSNNFLEQGVDVVVGTPRLALEASVGVPGDAGHTERRSGIDKVVRGQGALGPMIIGVSYIDTRPYQSPAFAHGHAVFTGLDVRWMQHGVQMRGEWISGRPFDGTTTNGGYVDAIVHRPGMGRVTAVGRAERLAYEAPPPFALMAQRYSAGTRIRLFDRLSAEIALVHHTRQLPQRRPTALDFGLTYSLRRD
jgi:hypothetical protein